VGIRWRRGMCALFLPMCGLPKILQEKNEELGCSKSYLELSLFFQLF
jgi:hypothetical protein